MPKMSTTLPIISSPKAPSLWSIHSVRLRVAISIALALTIEGLMRSNLNMVRFSTHFMVLKKNNFPILGCSLYVERNLSRSDPTEPQPGQPNLRLPSSNSGRNQETVQTCNPRNPLSSVNKKFRTANFTGLPKTKLSYSLHSMLEDYLQLF